jgi:hypothetical protein
LQGLPGSHAHYCWGSWEEDGRCVGAGSDGLQITHREGKSTWLQLKPAQDTRALHYVAAAFHLSDYIANRI